MVTKLGPKKFKNANAMQKKNIAKNKTFGAKIRKKIYIFAML